MFITWNVRTYTHVHICQTNLQTAYIKYVQCFDLYQFYQEAVGARGGGGGGAGPRLLTTALIYKASWREGVSRGVGGCEDLGRVCVAAHFSRVAVRMQEACTPCSLFSFVGVGEKSEAVSKPSQSSDIP